jgi:hypothetical protein
VVPLRTAPSGDRLHLRGDRHAGSPVDFRSVRERSERSWRRDKKRLDIPLLRRFPFPPGKVSIEMAALAWRDLPRMDRGVPTVESLADAAAVIVHRDGSQQSNDRRGVSTVGQRLIGCYPNRTQASRPVRSLIRADESSPSASS